MLSKTDYKFFDKAKQAALIADDPKNHTGCIAVYQGKIIGAGCSCNAPSETRMLCGKRHHPSDHFYPESHAEISCINQIRTFNINFAKVKLYLYRIRNDQPLGTARPCAFCMDAVKESGIREIYYTTNDGFAYEKIGLNLSF